jgi:hypothetical protein
MKSKLSLFSLILFVLFSCFSSFSYPASHLSVSNDDIKGTWQGSLGGALRIVIRIYASDSGYLKAEMDSPDQKAYGLHCDTVIFDGSNITLKLNQVSGYFEGKYNQDSISIVGNWYQNKSMMPLTIKKVNNVEEINQQLNPKPLLPNEVSIEVDGCRLVGTLKVPKSDKPVELVLIIAGSGPTDRDGNTPMLAGKNNSLKMISELLESNGIASLRFDKRGIGASDKVNESELTFDNYVNDAVEWIKFLRNDNRFSKIIIIGHSEGSLIGMIAANKTTIDKYISLCGAGEPIYNTILTQLKNNKTSQEIMNNCVEIIDSLKAGYMVKNIDPSLNMLFRPSVQPYIISWFKYDPCKEISKLTIPILVVGGTTDLQVDVNDAKLLSKAEPNAKLYIIENMNHILKDVPTTDRMENFKSYSNPDLPLSPLLSKALVEFIKKQ